MGIYVVPKGGDKERWLEEVGVELEQPPGWPPPDGTLPVVLVTNRKGEVAFKVEAPGGGEVQAVRHESSWSAAGVAFDERELRRFVVLSPADTRVRRYFLVPAARLREVTDEVDWRNRGLVPPWSQAEPC